MYHFLLPCAALVFALPAAAADLNGLFEQGRSARAAGKHQEAEAVYRSILARQPENADALYLLGLSVLAQNRFSEAVALFNAVLDKSPDYVDAAIARGRAIAFAGRHDEAEQAASALLREYPLRPEVWESAARISYYRGDLALSETRYRKTLALQPNHYDAMIGLADVLAASGRRVDAKAQYRAAKQLRPDAVEPDQGLARLELGKSDDRKDNWWEVALGGAYSSFSRQERDAWWEYGVQLTRLLGPRDRLFLRGDYSDRGDNEDSFAEAGGSVAVNDNWTLRGRAGGARSADFLPKTRIAGGASYRVLRAVTERDPTLITFDLQHSRYRSGNILTVAPGVEQYLLSGRAWITFQGMRIRDENDQWENGWLGRIDLQLLDRLRVGAGISDAPETDGLRTVDTRSHFGNLVWSFDDDLAFRLDYTREDRENSYIRNVIGLTVIRQF